MELTGSSLMEEVIVKMKGIAEAYENKSITEEVCTYDKGLFSSTYQKSCQNVTKIVSVPKENCQPYDEEQCTYNPIENKTEEFSKNCTITYQDNCTQVYKNITITTIEYPYTKTETGVSISDEMALMRHQIYELKTRLEALEAKP